LDLKRKGTKIGEHFDPVKEKYRVVKPKAYLVVDCQPAPVIPVQKVKNRCTLFLYDDFKTCVCQMHDAEATTTVNLQN